MLYLSYRITQINSAVCVHRLHPAACTFQPRLLWEGRRGGIVITRPQREPWSIILHYSAFPLRSFLFFPFLPSSSSPLPLLPSSLFPSLLCPVCVFPGSLLLSLFLFSLSISFFFDFALISPFYQRLFARLPPPPLLPPKPLPSTYTLRSALLR